MLLFCGRFFLGLYGTERVEEGRLRGFESRKKFRLLLRLSGLGLFIGGFLMLIWPRLS